MCNQIWVTFRSVAVSCVKQGSNVPAFDFQYFCTLEDGGVPSLFLCFGTAWEVSRWPRQANWKMREELRFGHLFLAPLLVEQAVLSLKRAAWPFRVLSIKRAAWPFRVLPGDAVISVQHQTTNILNRRHAGLGLRPPVTSFICRFAPFPSLQGLEVLVASRTWTCPFSLRNEVFRCSAVSAVLALLFIPVVHL